MLIVTWRPGGLSLSTGLWFVAASAFAGAAGAVLMKQVDGVKPFRFQAWVGLVSATVLTLASILLEDGQWTAATTTGRPLVAAVVFTALIVSVGAHSVYYHLIDRYEANLLAPLTLMTPLATRKMRRRDQRMLERTTGKGPQRKRPRTQSAAR